ncbi:hypothetical protein ABEB36_006984 [Hypothenemus hampei]|uniref:Transmembrane protein n=1 Tax=Hypothenemus hampei TaxID=57062 RepID=A0ABD1EUN2_HYPHA
MWFLHANKTLCVRSIIRQFNCPLLKYHTLTKNCGIASIKPKQIEYQIFKRNYFWIFKRRSNREIRVKDEPPVSYDLIYRCPFDNLLLSYQYIAFFAASAVGAYIVYKSIQEKEENVEKNRQIFQGGSLDFKGFTYNDRDTILITTIFGIFFILCQMLLSRIPVRIYRSPNRRNHVIYTLKTLPGNLNKLHLPTGNLLVTAKGTPLFGQDTTYEVKMTGEKFILYEQYFKRPLDMNILLFGEKNIDEEHDEQDMNMDNYQQKSNH